MNGNKFQFPSNGKADTNWWMGLGRHCRLGRKVSIPFKRESRYKRVGSKAPQGWRVFARVSIPFKRESRYKLFLKKWRAMRKQSLVSIPFKRESRYKPKNGDRKRGHKGVRVSIPFKRESRYKRAAGGYGAPRAPQKVSIPFKRESRYKRKKSEEMNVRKWTWFQFPSNGKADTNVEANGAGSDWRIWRFNSLQTGKQIQTRRP